MRRGPLVVWRCTAPWVWGSSEYEPLAIFVLCEFRVAMATAARRKWNGEEEWNDAKDGWRNFHLEFRI
jgi:hypothetical protein